MRVTILRFIQIVLLTALVGCGGNIVRPNQIRSTGNPIRLTAGKIIGQTFVAEQNGLMGIEVFLEAKESGFGELRMHLRNDPGANYDLATQTIDIQEVTGPGFYRFTIPPQSDSKQVYYYVFFEIEGEGTIEVGRSTGESYLDGAMYRNHESSNSQITFKLIYEPGNAVFGLIKMGLNWMGILVAGFFLFIIPGWGLVEWVFDKNLLSLAEKICLSGGISVAIYPLLLLWTDLVGIHLGLLYGWLPAIIGLFFLIWRYWKKRNNFHEKVLNIRDSNSKSHKLSLNLTLMIIIILIIATRFWVLRYLEFPLWGDSYQHTIITQLLVNNAGLFQSWEPYAKLTSFTYHYGFHAAASAFHWVTRLSIQEAVLWTGQLLNILAIIVLYPATVHFGKSHWGGVVGVLVAGLLSPMPMFYLNWGRYTQLTGLVILPVAIFFLWHFLNDQNPTNTITPKSSQEDQTGEGAAGQKKNSIFNFLPKNILNLRLFFLTCVVLAGLALSHYRVLIFGLLFLPAFWILRARNWESLRVVFRRTIYLALGTMILFGPWFVNLLGSRITDIANKLLTIPSDKVSTSIEQLNTIGDLSIYLPYPIWILMVVCLGWGLWKRVSGLALIGLWWFFILLAANPNWVDLPGTGSLTNFAVFIATYIPAGIIIGGALGNIFHLQTDETHPSQPTQGLLKKSTPKITIRILQSIIVIAGLYGAIQRVQDLQLNQHLLITRPDVRASSWIKNNLPKETRFLVNAFFAFNNSVIVGSDGGWWLPFTAKRETTLPPINYDFERGPTENYREWVNNLQTTIESSGIDHPDTLEMFRQRNITHIYIGQRQGTVNYDGQVFLDPDQMLDNNHFSPIYHQDRVWIFQICYDNLDCKEYSQQENTLGAKQTGR